MRVGNLTHNDAQLVIVNYFNVFRTLNRPYETDSKLLIDPNAMLSSTISRKRF
jgi:hypothetical protein